jgi:CO dehydrogenase/acetyl-CoA synthase beta subunit
VFSTEQSVIIEAIQSEKNNRHEIVIITDSLSTIMAAENRTPIKNCKAQTIRKMLDHEGPRITFLWLPSHVGIPGNEKVDQAVKEALDEDISTTERYLPDDLKKWLTEEDFKKREKRWKNRNNEMNERKSDIDRKEDTKEMPRKEHQDSELGIRVQTTVSLLQHLYIR